MYHEYNKFLQKRAAVEPNNTEHSQSLFGGMIETGKAMINKAKSMYDDAKMANDLFGNVEAAGKFRDAGSRLQTYQAGKAAEDYDPASDVSYVSSVVNDPGFQKRYTAWSKNNKNHKHYNNLANIYSKRYALAHAAKNPEDFKKLQKFRGLGLSDYLFGSVQDNYDFLRMMNGPMGAFANADQRKQLRNNYGWLELLWRIKKFFSEFGNWRPVTNPADYYKNPTNTIR